MKELAENLGVKISRMNTIADSLIKDGIAECTQPKDKSNQVKVRLTPQGKNIRETDCSKPAQISRKYLCALER